MKELGVEVDLRLMTDASAALGIATRRGLGNVRHIEVSKLWIQEKVSDGTNLMPVCRPTVDRITPVALVSALAESATCASSP